ncbi:hypothetical protein AMS68_006788 [Peltaster fructicola]|uniref:Uncharacterized protein n=1 Tax=Peltaster fructicola TaxID=286661 RepID=A0A6H0Y2Y1_9PEZI|nr:hypothetical protein AMS68_006788 [Peltaster fructicola]
MDDQENASLVPVAANESLNPGGRFTGLSLKRQFWLHLDREMHAAANADDFDRSFDIAESLLLEPRLPTLLRARAHSLLAIRLGTRSAVLHAQDAVRILNQRRMAGQSVPVIDYQRARDLLKMAEEYLEDESPSERSEEEDDDVVMEAPESDTTPRGRWASPDLPALTEGWTFGSAQGPRGLLPSPGLDPSRPRRLLPFERTSSSQDSSTSPFPARSSSVLPQSEPSTSPITVSPPQSSPPQSSPPVAQPPLSQDSLPSNTPAVPRLRGTKSTRSLKEQHDDAAGGKPSKDKEKPRWR